MGVIEQVAGIVNAITEPIRRRVAAIVARALITRVDDTNLIQYMQVELLADELRDDVERFQEYGFTSVPKVGAEAVAVFVGGNRDHGIIIAAEDRKYRLKGLADGEVAIYTDEGDKIHLKRGRKIEISTLELTINATAKTVINTAIMEINAVTSTKITSPQVDINSS